MTISTVPTKQLAECLGSTIGFASQIKHGRRQLPPRKCRLVSERFGIPLYVLRPDIFGEPDPNTHPKEPAQDPAASLPARTDNSERMGQEICAP